MLNSLSHNLNHLRHKIYDNHLKISGNLVGYNDVALYRYSLQENDYNDLIKTELEVVEPISCYIDFPGEVPNLTNTKNASAQQGSLLFVEDFLPILAYVPWYRTIDTSGSPTLEVLKVDIGDVLQFKLYDEFGEIKTLRYQIMERKSDYIESHVYREFVIAPERSDDVDFTTEESSGSTTVKDPNIDVGNNHENLYSEYD